MKSNLGCLTFFCGKMGSGKTTRAKELAEQCHAVLISEDEWLALLYPGQITNVESYIDYSARLKDAIKPQVQSLLLKGVSVILDFPANTLSQRDWFRKIFAEINAPHQLFYLALSDQVCLRQIEQRRIEQPYRETDTADMFWSMKAYFVEPNGDEGFSLLVERQE